MTTYDELLDLDRRARVICKLRDPNGPICTDAPCSLCLAEARKEIEEEQRHAS